MTPTERIQLISELRRSFPVHHRLQVAMEDYEELAIAANAPVKPTKPITSRAAYMREHRKKERKIIQDARNAITSG